MIAPDASDEELKAYIERQDGFVDTNVDVQILGRSTRRGQTQVLISWTQEANITTLMGICSNIVNKRGKDITHRFITIDTPRSVIRRITYRYRKFGIKPPKMVNMSKYVGIRHNKKVTITRHNVYLLADGAGVLRYTN